MAAATILFVDIVGYSRAAAVKQTQLIKLFNTTLRSRIRHLFGLKPNQLICLPTGDGVALVFLHVNSKRKWSIEAIVDIISDLQDWSRLSALPMKPDMRMGVHVGSIEMVKDINGRSNVCGSAINLAQRVMDAARPRQVLFSEDAVREYVGKGSNQWKISARKHRLFRLDGPFEIQVKHGELISVFRLLPERIKDHGWNDEDPEIKFWLSVSPTTTSKPIKGGFSERLQGAKDIALIQLTGERLANAIAKGEVTFSRQLRRLIVMFPIPRYCVNSAGRPDRIVISKLRASIVAWKQQAVALQKVHPAATIEIRQFSATPYYGASLIDWGESGGFIHASPYIWGVEAAQCPGFDIVWAGKKPLPLYKTYVTGFENLYGQSKKLN